MNKVWLITGASSGFGRAIAEAALADGDVVVGAARRPEALDDLVAAHPDQMEALRLDVADTAAAGDAVRDVVARHGYWSTTRAAHTSVPSRRPARTNCGRCSTCTSSARPR